MGLSCTPEGEARLDGQAGVVTEGLLVELGLATCLVSKAWRFPRGVSRVAWPGVTLSCLPWRLPASCLPTRPSWPCGLVEGALSWGTGAELETAQLPHSVRTGLCHTSLHHDSLLVSGHWILLSKALSSPASRIL